ncbi:hypothetical protein [Pseudolabrys sp. FHR47]|uniref:hypothetical protein n=1 Tax=Pseudolabrys sp. FHR47 TaxID=2562284 RepID=UPI0010BE891B|nr:hypothetical protein [Pseudolabrys sp. FHR47]
MLWNNWVFGFPILIGFISDPILLKVTTYTLCAIVTYLAMFASARLFGLSFLQAVLTAWGTCFIYYPYIYPQPVYPIGGLGPWGGVSLALVCLSIVLFRWVGLRGWAITVGAVVAIAVLIVVTIAFAPYYAPLFAPLYVAFGIGFVVTSGGRERWIKVACGALLALAAMPTIVPFLAGLFLNTAAAMFPGDMTDYERSLDLISIMFSGGWGAYVATLFIICAWLASKYGPPVYRWVATASLIYYVALVGIGLFFHYFASSVLFGPRPRDFEVLFWPFMVMTIVAGLSVPVAWATGEDGIAIARRWSTPSARLIAAVLAVALMLGLSFFDRGKRAYANFWLTPPRQSPLSEILTREIRVEPGRPYRGIVATYMPMAKANAGLDWSVSTLNDRLLADQLGNGHRAIDLWYFGIPTLFIYNQLISPTYFQMVRYFLAAPEDRQRRNVIIVSRVNPDYLRSIGVRYVLTDAPIRADVHLGRRWEIPLAHGRTLYLYELTDANLGDASPTRVTVADSAAATVEAMRRPGFDFRRDTVTDSPVEVPLVPATDVSFAYERSAYRLKARSAGTSLLVLPIQYSRCLEAVPVANTAEPVLRRVNILQAGVQFSGRLDMRLRLVNGPLENSWCRLADLKRLRELRIKDALPGWVDQARISRDTVPPGPVRDLAVTEKAGGRIAVPPSAIAAVSSTGIKPSGASEAAIDGDGRTFLNIGPLPPKGTVNVDLTFPREEEIEGIDILPRDAHGHLTPMRASVYRFDKQRQAWAAVVTDVAMDLSEMPWRTLRIPRTSTERLRIVLTAGMEAGNWYLQPAEILPFRTDPAATDKSLSWTSPGDDGEVGYADRLDARWSRDPVQSEDDWQVALPTALPLPAPGLGGEKQSRSLWRMRAPADRPYLALRAVDPAGNAGPIASLRIGP